jgi:bifunctional UDP-N-acetylglucosamine pyrophosphorylase/glucosamine-1-phosphate N-acetyltransferase
MSLSIIILAAGQGTRMRSAMPKVLHPLAGQSLLEHVHVASLQLQSRKTYVVYGHGGDQVKDTLTHLPVDWVEQAEQLGTGHAVQQPVHDIPDEDQVLILYGDVPLITSQTLERLVSCADETGFSLLTSDMDDPTGYGRIIRDEDGSILKIVEQKDATEEELSVSEINTGMMTINAGNLKEWLSRLENNNAQGEYYLTDVIQMAVTDGIKIQSTQPEAINEIKGVNSRAQLAELERYYQMVQANYLMSQGVTLMDPDRFDLRGSLDVGQDITIDINVVIEGSVSIGNNVSIGANSVIRNADIGDETVIKENCVIEDTVIGKKCVVGPFARLRPQARLADDVHIGNFVEVKKSEINQGSKINHLSYVGDAVVGKNVNIGAGTITCNYDGANKYKTIIEDDVFVGSDTQLVAPVRVGKGVTIGAGATVTKDVEAGALIHNKFERRIIKDYQRPRKEKK